MPSFDFPEIPMGDVSTRKDEMPLNTGYIASPAHSIKIIVPGEPTPKGRPRARITDTTRARRFISFYQPADTKNYERRVGHEARQAMRGRGVLLGALRLEVVVHLSPPASWSATKKEKAHLGMILPTSRPDADNFLKLAADALNGICWHDDAQIVDMSVKKRYSQNPSLEIEIFAI